MSSFASTTVSVTFTADRENFKETRDARVATQEIPGGDVVYVDLAGRQSHKFGLKILLANATAWGALNSAVGQVGTLQVDTLDTHQAVLMSVGRDAPMPDGQIAATVDFLITDD